MFINVYTSYVHSQIIHMMYKYVYNVVKLRSEEAILTLCGQAVGGTKAREKLSLTLEKLRGGSKQEPSS